MTSRELLYRKIKEELKKESGIKARVIAKRLSEKKGDVNSELHKNVAGEVKWGEGVQINRPNEANIRKWLEESL